MLLVDYESSDEEDAGQLTSTLPGLPDTFTDLYSVEPRRGDDPVFHQGRSRIVEHSSGQWPAHIYLEVRPTLELKNILGHVLKEVKGRGMHFHSLLTSDLGVDRDLHISLSRPLMLSTGQKEQVRAKVLAISSRRLELQFDGFAILSNDECTRDFLVAALSPASCQAVKSLCDEIDGRLAIYGLPALYEQPLHHVSFAWRRHSGGIENLDLTRQARLLQLQNIAFDAFKLKIGRSVDTIRLDS